MKNIVFYALILMTGLIYQNCSQANFSQANTDPNAGLEIQSPDSPVGTSGHGGGGGGGGGGEEDDSQQVAAFCASIRISQVLVSVNHLELNSSQALVTPGLGSYNLMSLSTGFVVQTNTTTDANQLRLVLNDTGNKLVDQSGAEFSLKTPSQQNSGLKLILPGNVTLAAGTSYRIKADFDPDRSIVHAGSKCLLKPVIRVTSITPEGSGSSDE
jgi:hypothetical protein